MLRVAVDATPLLDHRTGIGTVVTEVVHGLAVRRDVELVAYGMTRAYLDDLRRALPAGVRAISRPIPARTMRAIWARLPWPTIEAWTGPVDVVHGLNYFVPPARRAVEVISVHDLTPLHFPELCDHETIHYPAYIRRAIARGAHIHTGSQFVADEIVDAFSVEPERVHAIHDGIRPPVGGDPAEGRRLAGAEQYVLALGTLEPRKNLGALIDAFGALGDDADGVRLVLAGGQGWGPDEVTPAAARLRDPERLARLGRVGDEQRAHLLAGATVLAYPSRYEGFGMPPLEAMALGIPVVATRVGSLPEVLGDAAILVAPDVDEIAEGLRRALHDTQLRESLRTAGPAQAAKYQWDECVDALVRLYSELAAARPIS